MFMIEPSDAVAIQRTFNAQGRDAALADLRRRYMNLTDQSAPAVLDRVLEMQAKVIPFPRPNRNERGASHKPRS